MRFLTAFGSLSLVAMAGCSADFCRDYFEDGRCPAEGGQGGQGGIGGSSSSMGGTGGTGGAPSTCNPHDEAYAPTAECGVFVKEGATGTGTPDSPAGTLTEAIAKGGTLYVCEGTYVGGVTVTDVSIYGGLDCADWKHQPTARSAIVGLPNAPALTLTGAGPVLLENLAITAPNATTTSRSSIALWVEGSTASLERIDLVAGNGGAGMPGTDGGAQMNAAPGGMMGSNAGSVPPSGGPASSVNTCPDGNTSGGKGGDGGMTMNGNGQSGENGDVGAGLDGGVGEVGANACQPGKGFSEPGANGTHATPGAGALTTDFGGLSSSQYINAPGTDGGDGTRGKGGGGGGGSKATAAVNGAGGGSGGAGGCGGLKGTAGGGGGSSLGLVSRNAALTLEDVTVSLGVGGVGGKGGNGQPGQLGGPKGTGGTGGLPNPGCDGGAGGRGGNGSSAGGGRGGHAIGVLFSGTAPTGTPTLSAPGSFGAGGLGGSNGIDNATPGADGAVAPSQEVAAQ